MKDFVAKVGKSYETATENTEEADTMSLKVSILTSHIYYYLLYLMKIKLPIHSASNLDFFGQLGHKP